MSPEELVELWRSIPLSAETTDEVADAIHQCADQLHNALKTVHHEIKPGPAYHTFLVAISVGPEPSREAAERSLHTMLPSPDDPRGDLGPGGWVDCWWIAEDVRHDRSDNDSAIFIPDNITQEEARAVLDSLSKAKTARKVRDQFDQIMRGDDDSSDSF